MFKVLRKGKSLLTREEGIAAAGAATAEVDTMEEGEPVVVEGRMQWRRGRLQWRRGRRLRWWWRWRRRWLRRRRRLLKDMIHLHLSYLFDTCCNISLTILILNMEIGKGI